MDNLKQILQQTLSEIKATCHPEALESIRIKYLGKKGVMNEFMQTLRHLTPEEKPAAGARINDIKKRMVQALSEHADHLKKQALDQQLKRELIDVTLPGQGPTIGTLHPITQTIERITRYFTHFGFHVEEGPEIESDYYNFEALNIPPHHSARAMHDTFYIDPATVLRTHTSPVQIRTMEVKKPPIAIICPGKVYRCDADQTHSPMFHQVEALYIDQEVSFANLKTFLSDFLKAFFKNEHLNIRFRPSYFPFTEPSAEVDIEWGKDENGQIKWLEVLGCGMVHPNVLNPLGIDSERYSGFALGLGVERFAMLQYGIKNMRYFFENDIKFLMQF